MVDYSGTHVVGLPQVHFWPQIDKLNSPKLNYWTLTSHYYDGKIKILDLMMIGYDYAVAGHKATFSGARPLLRAQGHFYGHQATFLGTRPISGHKATFPGTSSLFLALPITNAVYGLNAVSGHTAIFLPLPMLFSDPCRFWAKSHFLSITNADYGPNAVSGHKAFFLALPMLITDPMPFLGTKPFSFCIAQ